MVLASLETLPHVKVCATQNSVTSTRDSQLKRKRQLDQLLKPLGHADAYSSAVTGTYAMLTLVLAHV